MAITIQIRPGPNFAAEILAGLQEAFDDHLKPIVEKRSAEAVGRVQKNVAGLHTDVPVLRIRSGAAVTSIGSILEEAPMSLHATVGAVAAPPEVEEYLWTNEKGKTIRPVKAKKLAFPPGENWHPETRDSSGTQIATARDIIEDPPSYGFKRVATLDKAIVGISAATGLAEVLFIRRLSVKIPPRRPVSREQDKMVEDMEKDMDGIVVR